jgi:WS/DGAT/MGAT family acyltransferase
MIKQLSGLDSMFLYMENSRMPLELSSLHIYDPSTAPSGKVRFKEILATFDKRLEQAGLFHRKILELPFSIDHPYWVEDEHFDIEYHVRHIALPKPGDWRQLMIQVARLQSRELDKTRPLWEAYVIEGLDNVEGLKQGCFALYLKMHHATVDGVSGAALQTAIHDLEPIQADASDYEPHIRKFGDSAPNMAALIAKSPINNFKKTAKLFLGIANAVPRLVKGKIAASKEEPAEDVPTTVFNRGQVSANRVVDGRMFDLNDFKAIARSQADAKVNDVALAVVSGALRRYLESKDDLPVEPLITACPLNVRSENTGDDVDNMVSMMNTSLCTDIEDPVERLNEIVKGTQRAKRRTEIVGADTMTIVPLYMPAFIAHGLMPPLANVAARLDAVTFNTMVSNVAGIQHPLYFCGAKMLALFAMGPVVDRAGIFHTAFSFDGKMTITVTACREMMPDPEFYAECLQSSFDELRTKAIGRKPRKAKTKIAKKTAKKKRSTARKKTANVQ